MTASNPKLEIQSPKLFTTSAIIIGSSYGFILVIPVLVAMMIVTVFHFGILTFVIPLAAIVLATFFLPLGFGNPYIARLTRPLRPNLGPNQDLWLVQLTREPRVRSGIMAALEDADDVGFLWYTDSTVEFSGDSVRLSVPYANIMNLKQKNAGPRALFAYGQQTSFSVTGLGDTGLFRFSERSSWILPDSRRTAERMYSRLRNKLDLAAPEQTGKPA